MNATRLLLAISGLTLLAAPGCRSGARPAGPQQPPLARAPGNVEDASRRGAVRGPVYPRDFTGTRPLTRAERTRFAETSRHADVMQFVDSLRALGAPIATGSIGTTVEGRDIPYVIASRPSVATPQEARRLNRPIVYVQANIHGGEVEGKEALQALLRDLLFERRANVLDSLVLIAVPLYNADGNERLGPQERNRQEQNGPALVGQRANADSLDLNRDYTKAEAPETRASLAMLDRWDPDVFVDLHTTDGSYHGYALTYAPSLNPAALVTGPVTRDSVLPELRRRLRIDYRTETFDYGNFASQDSVQRGWFTYDHRPRFGTNYMGLRGRVSVLGEAYSHDPFERRVASTYQFVWELLSLVAEYREDVQELTANANRRVMGWGTQAASSPAIALRSQLGPASRREAVRVEEVVPTGDSTRTEPGLPPGLRRTGRITTPTIPIFDRFVATRTRQLPYAYAFAAELTPLLPALRQHGVIVERLAVSTIVAGERFTIDSVVRSPRTFQRHQEVRLEGNWHAGSDTLVAGTYLVRTGQPLAVLAMYLLEPESDDGFAAWNLVDPWVRAGGRYPVVRVMQPVLAPLTLVDPR